jgi:hypothetical protein
MRRFPADDFNILARNIFQIWAKVKKIAIFRYPCHTETVKVAQMAPILASGAGHMPQVSRKC